MQMSPFNYSKVGMGLCGSCCQVPGAAFLSINLVYFLVYVLGKSLLAITAMLALCAMTMGAVCSLLSVTQDDSGSAVEVVSKKYLMSCVDTLYERLNDNIGCIRALLLWHDTKRSTKVAAVLLGIAYVGHCFSLSLCLFLATWTAFLWTFFSSAYQQCAANVVDAYFAKACEMARRVAVLIPRLEDGDAKLG